MDKQDLEKKVEEHAAEIESGKPKNKKTTLKYVINISLVLIITAVAIFLAIKDDAGEIFRYLRTADWRYLLIIVGIMFGCIGVRSFLYFAFAHLFTRRYHFHQAIAVDQIGQFYNAITPGASGGQIMQAYTYRKQGMAVSSAVSILAMYSIVYQVILIIFGLISFIIKYDFITALGNVKVALNDSNPIYLPIWPLTIVGFILNVGVIALVFLMGYWHGFHNFVMGPVVSLCHKLKIVKNPDKTRENLRIQVENFKIEFRRLSTNIPFLLLVVVSFTAYMILKFCIPYFVGLALGNQSQAGGFWDCIFLSNYHQMVTGLIPIPGSAGVSEFVFYNLFVNEGDMAKGFFCVFKDAPELIDGVLIEHPVDQAATRALARSSLLLWRSSTFVIPILIGGFVAAFYRSSPKDVAHSGDMPNRQTFYSLQQQTYVERAQEVESLVETTRLTRMAILEKLDPTQPLKKKKKKNDKTIPNDISQPDYDEVTVDDSEDN